MRRESAFEDRVLHDRFDGDLDLLRAGGRHLPGEHAAAADARLREACGAGMRAPSRGIAHRLRGSLANFGAEEAVEAAFRLEKMGVEGDLAGADDVARR